MKVVLVTHGFPPDQMAGAEIYAWNLARGLEAGGVSVCVFTPGSRPAVDEYEVVEEDVDGLRVMRLNNNFTDLHRLESTYSNPAVNAAFSRLLETEKPDVVHVHHVIGTSVDVIPIARRAGVPVIVTLHDFWFHCARGQRMTPRQHLCQEVQPWRCSLCVGKKRARYAMNWMGDYWRGRTRETTGTSPLSRLGLLLPRLFSYGLSEGFVAPIRRRLDAMGKALLEADLIISPSEFLRDEFIRQGVPADRIEFSENGMDMSRFAELSGAADSRSDPQGPPRFAFVGTLIPTKGIELLVDAFQGIPADAATLDIWGEGGGPDGPRYAARLEAKNGHPGVKFRGRFDNRELAKALSATDVLVLPSLWYENAPLTLHEAAAAGVPVVTADHGGMREFARRFETAVTFEPGNRESLEKALMRFVQEPGLVQDLSRSDRKVRTIDEDVAATTQRYQRVTADS